MISTGSASSGSCTPTPAASLSPRLSRCRSTQLTDAFRRPPTNHLKNGGSLVSSSVSHFLSQVSMSAYTKWDYIDAVQQQHGVSDQAPVAPPPERFRADDRRGSLQRRQQARERGAKFHGCHVIGVRAKARLAQRDVLAESARGVRRPPSAGAGTYAIPDSGSQRAISEALNHGQRREPGKRRTSTTRCTPALPSHAANVPASTVPWPAVKSNGPTVRATARLRGRVRPGACAVRRAAARARARAPARRTPPARAPGSTCCRMTLELMRRNSNSVFYEPLVAASVYAFAAVLDRVRYGRFRMRRS